MNQLVSQLKSDLSRKGFWIDRVLKGNVQPSVKYTATLLLPLPIKCGIYHFKTTEGIDLNVRMGRYRHLPSKNHIVIAPQARFYG